MTLLLNEQVKRQIRNRWLLCRSLCSAVSLLASGSSGLQTPEQPLAREAPNGWHAQSARLYASGDIWNLSPPPLHSCCQTLLLPRATCLAFSALSPGLISKHKEDTGNSQGQDLALSSCSSWSAGHQALRDGEPGQEYVTGWYQGESVLPLSLDSPVPFQNILGKGFLLTIRVCF